MKAQIKILFVLMGVFLMSRAIGAAPAKLRSPAVIINSGSTNTAAYRIVITRSGQTHYQSAHQSRSRKLPSTLARKFFAHLANAMPLDQLPAQTTCLKSASFGSTTTVEWAGQRSADLSCTADARAQALYQDVQEITQASQR
ncbi:hypothetical protein [Anthocerotibacter panamensis]|uniref:hypothetical protein n=1 Tax=Anthocerotibacter panamensis TaxID=2857077 RepID=UPI001C407335|nr:hypothetical protein [Anthocerotibacter panamensis]